MRIPVNRLDSAWPPSESADTADEAQNTSWSEMAKAWEDNLKTLLADHPKLAIAAAAACGLAVGWLVKRR
jgi:ElaB/YqjD/DUF883 family membrane-anchored ribosome-binding protein